MVDLTLCEKCNHPKVDHSPRDRDQGSWGLEQCNCGCVRDGDSV